MAVFRCDARGINLERTLACGQSFRWRKEGESFWGVAGEKPLLVRREGGELVFEAPEEEPEFWQNYFGLDQDYTLMEAMLAADEQTAPCLDYSRGIRILRQQPYETLITFILSANNNVGRIAGIVEKLCRTFGNRREWGGREYFTFPAAETLAGTGREELAACGAGYRAPYVSGAAGRIAQGFDLDALRLLPYEEARRELRSLPGVGPKVADCILLFSLGFTQAFPVDVWVGRISQWLYPQMENRRAAELAAKRFGPWAGAAQQYLFHYARQIGMGQSRSRRMTEKKREEKL